MTDVEPRNVRTASRLDWIGFVALVGFAAALQVSIAVAHACLAVVLVCWGGAVILDRTAPEVPRFFWPLLAYAGVTLVSAAFSADPQVSFLDAKQLLLFLIVPAVHRLARGARATTLIQVIITVGAASAAIGIIQYGILKYDHLGQRPQGMLGHYMTYSGLLLLVIGAASARLLFDRRDLTWPALVMPALVVALVLTFTRSAWVGVCASVGLLLALKDLRLLAALPVVAAVVFALAPPAVTARLSSIGDLRDPTTRDRLAMLRTGARLVRDRPLTGVGPNMIERVYPRYRDPEAVELVTPHLHNVPVQIAAERGLPAVLIWIWFVASAARGLARKLGASTRRFLPAAGLAALAGMLAAGMFEYNFGDSEFLMLFLVLIALPYAADRESDRAARGSDLGR